MNPRIRELAEQAREYANSKEPYEKIKNKAWIDVYDEKFAELIVAECCQQINSQCFPSNSREWCEKGAWNGYLVAQIREHFGVES